MDVDTYLAAKFSQSASKKIKRKVTMQKLDTFNAGLCSGLVMVWTGIKLKEVSSSRKKPSTDRMEELEKNASLALSVHSGPGSSFGMLDQRVSGNSRLKLSESSDKGISVFSAANQAYSLGDVASKVKQGGKRKCYHFGVNISLPTGGGGNHSLGIYLSSGKVMASSRNAYFFDPNYGEYKVPINLFETFLTSFFKQKYTHATVRVAELVQVTEVT